MKRQFIKSHDVPFIHEAVQLLQKDPARSFTVSSLALEVGINSFKLREGFKQLYNRTIYQFRLDLRLGAAVDLLENTDLTIEQIAYKVGFDSRDSMGRCFRRRFQCSPREWRNDSCGGPDTGYGLPLSCLNLPQCN